MDHYTQSPNSLKNVSDFIFPYEESYFELSKLLQIAMTLPVGIVQYGFEP